MKKILISLLMPLLTLTMASSVWALQTAPQPEKCPGVDSIKATAFLTAKQLRDGTYGAIQINTYDTQETWAFVVANISATSVTNALDNAKAALPSLSFDFGPMYVDSQNIWGCIYNIGSGYQAVAFTPLPSNAINTDALFKSSNLR